MKRINHTLMLLAIMLVSNPMLMAQVDTDRAAYIKYEKGFYYNEILPALKKQEPQQDRRSFKMLPDEGFEYPDKITQFEYQWHNQPESQGSTGTCWAYAATSFLESEVYRLQDKKVHLSEMYFVYMDYVVRARDFVKTRGETYFNHGSEANAVTRMLEKYGAMPFEAYPGKAKNQKFHDHGQMMKEMKGYLQSVKDAHAWNEKTVVETIKEIMNFHMGTPPSSFEVNGENYSPESYAKEYLRLDAGDYFSFMSTSSKDFWQKGELVEPDNWWHADNYYNLPLEDYFQLIDRSIDKGFTICICGDVSEPGHLSQQEVSVIPDFDIPSEYINQASRELRLNNKSTTDDHCIHLVGHATIDNERWYLIKDSGAGGFDGPNKGYRFFHEDYIRLKMMNILVHKDAARPELDRMIKK